MGCSYLVSLLIWVVMCSKGAPRFKETFLPNFDYYIHNFIYIYV
jgi:hypothetical protein